MSVAADSVTLDLNVGRFMRGPLLGLAVLLRELPLMLLDGFGSERLAPAWIVVRDRSSGAQLMRVAAGREPGAGEVILRRMQQEAEVLDRETFLQRWQERR